MGYHKQHYRVHIGDTISLNEKAFLVYLGVFLFYPLAGFLAAVHIGRYRTIVASLIILLIGIIICVSFDSILYLVNFSYKLDEIDKIHAVVFGVFGVIEYILSVKGLAGRTIQRAP